MSNQNQPSDPRLRDIFLKAVDITDTARREGFLDGVCFGDPALRAQLDALLASHRDDSFLEHPAIRIESEPASDSASAATVRGVASDSTQNVVGPQPVEHAVPENVRYFGDYDVLGEIARGGMGVVYRSRQKSLNRIVALKMIRAGRLADDAEVKRFRTEAEAAANLQHPNIVAIHEIGDHEGQHYFSMDYVEGKDLAQLVSGGPLSTALAARYVKTIAEAIAYAHQRGTLHRDLKPHNVLIDQHDQPRITDFGLAKLTKHDSSLTLEGAVMGSPSYMPPEQATGRHDQVGPHSDVYSLGAILYELLTGQPPFKAETPLATLHKVVEEEATPPSKINPRVSADLETICLKCLEKSPERRYATARALAEDLERFLNDEPVLARPASVWRKAWSWSRRHPRVMVLGMAVGLALLLGTVFWLQTENDFLRFKVTHPNYVKYAGLKTKAAKAVISSFAVTYALVFCGSVAVSSIAAFFERLLTQPGRVFKVIQFVRSRQNLLLFLSLLGVIALGHGILLLKQSVEAHIWEGASLAGFGGLGFITLYFGAFIIIETIIEARRFVPLQVVPIPSVEFFAGWAELFRGDFRGFFRKSLPSTKTRGGPKKGGECEVHWRITPYRFLAAILIGALALWCGRAIHTDSGDIAASFFVVCLPLGIIHNGFYWSARKGQISRIRAGMMIAANMSLPGMGIFALLIGLGHHAGPLILQSVIGTILGLAAASLLVSWRVKQA